MIGFLHIKYLNQRDDQHVICDLKQCLTEKMFPYLSSSTSALHSLMKLGLQEVACLFTALLDDPEGVFSISVERSVF